jgi:hypothetical protein
MKEEELRTLTTCAVCGKKLGQCIAGKLPMFYVVKVQQYILDNDALQRQQGLAMMMGGNGLLASVMGPDEDMAKATGEEEKKMVCTTCMAKTLLLEGE